MQSQIYHLGSYDILLGAIPSSLQAVSSSSRTTGTGQVFWRDAMGRREVFLWKTGWWFGTHIEDWLIFNRRGSVGELDWTCD